MGLGNLMNEVTLNQVFDRLFVGDWLMGAGLVAYNPHKVTAVLCVHQENSYKKDPNIIYALIPFDDGHEIPERQFKECLSWLKFMYENGHNILIHCAAGRSRSVTITAAFMHYAGLATFEEALQMIALARPEASNPHPAVVVSAKKMLKIWPYCEDAFKE